MLDLHATADQRQTRALAAADLARLRRDLRGTRRGRTAAALRRAAARLDDRDAASAAAPVADAQLVRAAQLCCAAA